MFKKISFTLFMLAFALIGQALAQESVSAEKQAAIKELMTLINTGNKAEDFVNLMSQQMEVSRKSAVTAALDERTDLTASERKALEEALINEQGDRIKRFQERLMQKLDFNRMMDEIGASVYDKYYTLEEIKDLAIFYKSPTGQKSLKLMTTIMTESMRQVQERLIPKIPVIIRELQEEDQKEIEQQINKKKPRTVNKES
ncbi:MAG: DUF2059 domain-containing protein [Pyrinomonadaceae bacterium]